MTEQQLKIASLARRQIKDATSWWQDNRKGAPQLLEHEIESALRAIREHVHLGSKVPSSRFADLRRFPIGKSGYWLYYRPAAGGITVLALWHESRGRGPAV